ncbi:MAG TPA: S8 family serine peptidase, partial [Candidatus Xenobia bacterium]
MSPRYRVLLFVVAVFLTVIGGGWWVLHQAPAAPPPDTPTAAEPAESVPGELLVEIHADRVAQLEADAPHWGGHVVIGPWSRMDDEVMARVLVAPGQEDTAAAQVRREAGVDSVERDYIAHAYAIKKPDDPLYPYQWNMRKVGAEEAWRGSTGQGAVVAVIDTGVAYENYKQFHRVEDMKAETFVPGFNAINGTEHANDDHAHGTHVAGTIAEATHNGIGAVGLSPDAKIMPIKVLSGSGAGSYGAICDGIRFAADHHANVINMSLGGPMGTMALKDACRYAYRKGVTIVCAAGNSGSTNTGYPAKYDVCLAVSSIRDDNTLAWYSNRGSRIDIAAPGGDTRVDQNNDGYPDGILQNTIAVQDPTKEGY